MAYKKGYKDMGMMGKDKSYAKMSNEKYMSKDMSSKVMGHEKKPGSCAMPVGEGFKEVKPNKRGNLGYPAKAWDYKY